MARTSSKSKSTTTVQPPSASPRYGPYPLFKSVLLVFVLALASLATQLALHPLYGSTPAGLNQTRVKLLACFVSVLLPQPSEWLALLGLASWLGYAPYATYALGKWSTKWNNPLVGPAVVEGLVLVPAIGLGVALVREWNNSFLRFMPGPMSLKVGVAISTFNCLNVLESWLWRTLPLGGLVHSSNIFVALAAVLATFAGLIPSASQSISPPKTKSSATQTSRSYKALLPLLLPVLSSAVALSSPPSASPRLPYVRSTPAPPLKSRSPTPPSAVRVLARAHSVTGLILVGEHVQEHFRFLRVDHSLLGGRWVGEKVVEAKDGLGDSIYSTFVLQEAARLVERREIKKDAKERALFIGLGVGIAAQAFIAHGINTSVVEIDPVVYSYAREYFGLPEPNHVYLEDARGWVHRHATTPDKYDFVVHDCFSGGGVPTHIFTVEFWEELKGMVKPDGVVAVNFAGQLGSDAARAIFLTLRRTFGRCRAFHDHMESEFDESYTFFNIVFFCAPSESAMLRFRVTKNGDYLRSHLRRHVLNGLAQREIEPRRILGNVTYTSEKELVVEGEDTWVLRDSANRLGEWQQASGLEHWTVMREVLPDIFWETY